MSLVNYLRQKSGSWLAIKSILFVLVWTGVYTILILSNAKIVEPGTPALSNARLTISNLHNQLYFLAPLLIVSSLLFFSRPQSIEFFYLVLKKRLRQYLLIYTILETILLISSFLLSFRDFSFRHESATGFTNRLRNLALAGALFRRFCLALLFRDRDLPGW